MESKLTFLGGAGSVTGANFLFETGGKKILIDCGLRQGSSYDADKNYEDFAFDPSSIDILFVTHAHADHIGRVPKLVHDGFRGIIFSTPATRDLSEVMFADSVHILGEEARKKNVTPLYESHDIETALSLWKTYDYHESFDVGDGITVRFLDAGHILGAGMVEFSRADTRFVATGDLGNSPAPLLRDTETLADVNYLLMESVYGDRVHENRGDRVKLLREILNDTYENRRTLLIPAFAIQRTQLLLYEINKMVEAKEVPEMPVYLDSPLASKVTDIYRNYTHLFNERVQKEIAAGDNVLDFPKFTIVREAEESEKILSVPAPKVIIAGSGMSIGGRILMHEKRLLSDPNTTLLFVGYQGTGTLGSRIQDGESEVRIGGDTVRVRARIETIRGFSAHKDRDGLVDFVASTKGTLEKVFVAMGESDSSHALAQRLRDTFGVAAIVPEEGETQTLTF